MRDCYLCGDQGRREVLSLQVSGWDAPLRLWRCRSCDLEFIWPQPAGSGPTFYNEEYYRNGYLPFADERRAQFRGLLSRLRQQGASGPLLDVGCGVGLLVSVAVEEGWSVQGLEPSPDACRLARELYGLELMQSQLTSLSPDPVYGVVVLWHVLAHVADPLALLRRAAEMLRPDGLLLISSINWNDPHYRLAKTLTRWKKVNAIHIPTILWRFHEGHLAELARRAGLRMELREYGPRAFREPAGWKRRLLERGFAAYRRITGTGEEMRVWCRARRRFSTG